MRDVPRICISGNVRYRFIPLRKVRWQMRYIVLRRYCTSRYCTALMSEGTGLVYLRSILSIFPRIMLSCIILGRVWTRQAGNQYGLDKLGISMGWIGWELVWAGVRASPCIVSLLYWYVPSLYMQDFLTQSKFCFLWYQLYTDRSWPTSKALH